MTSSSKRAHNSAHKKSRKLAVQPHTYRLNRRQVDKNPFSQIRTNVNLSCLSLKAAMRAPGRCPSLDELKQDVDISYIAWKGSPHSILSCSRVVAGLPGWPTGEVGWTRVVHDFDNVAFKIRDAAIATGGPLVRADGGITFGISCGSGHPRPTNLKLPSKIHNAIQELNRTEISRVLHFAQSAFAILAPKMYRTYVDKLHSLFERMPELEPMLHRSPFSTASFDFRNGRPCDIHRGHPNGSAGWCALFAGGKFDPTTGGHLYLPQAELIIEFPPGATVLIPSTLVYGILPVPAGQTRYTFSQFFPADVMRFIDNEFRPECIGAVGNPETPRMHWSQRDVELLSRWDELHIDREKMNLLTAPVEQGA